MNGTDACAVPISTRLNMLRAMLCSAVAATRLATSGPGMTPATSARLTRLSYGMAHSKCEASPPCPDSALECRPDG
jgi:hypothetical protein